MNKHDIHPGNWTLRETIREDHSTAEILGASSCIVLRWSLLRTIFGRKWILKRSSANYCFDQWLYLGLRTCLHGSQTMLVPYTLQRWFSDQSISFFWQDQQNSIIGSIFQWVSWKFFAVQAIVHSASAWCPVSISGDWFAWTVMTGMFLAQDRWISHL